MKTLILVTGMMAAGVSFAQTPAPARAEISHLMGVVETSGCQFSRNGSWHDAKSARKHLEKKFTYLDRKGLAPTTELFIERGASASSMSGKPYQMQCAGTAPVSSRDWLSTELKRYRQQAAK